MRSIKLGMAIAALAGCGAPDQASRADYPTMIPMEVILAQTAGSTNTESNATLLARAAALRARANAMQ